MQDRPVLQLLAAGARPVAAIAAGALLLSWPALVNLYPIVFSDTHAFLVMGGEPQMVWDKPFIYGPVLRLLHLNLSLWLPLLAQVLIVSHVLWLLRAAFGPATARFHLALCLVLGAFSAAPWFASLLMPDILAPVVVVSLFLLGFSASLRRGQRIWLVVLSSIGIASHLAYLPVALVVIGLALILGGRRVVMVPLAVAVGLLLAGNAIGHGKLGLSPYGSVFALARLITDRPAQQVLALECPYARWRMCDWQGRFPADSDTFLWDGDGPVWSTPGGAKGLAAEASAIVWATLWQAPAAVLRSGLANGWEQLGRVRLGDTLGNDWLEGSITGSLSAYFPPAEMARFRGGRQMGEQLRSVAEPLNGVHGAALVLGAGATMVIAWRRRGRLEGRLAVLVLAAVLTNAAVSGALSRPHDRYQARIAWLVLLPPLLKLPLPKPLGVRPGSGLSRIGSSGR